MIRIKYKRKKNNNLILIFVVLVAILMTMSIGYAIFTDQNHIVGTANIRNVILIPDPRDEIIDAYIEDGSTLNTKMNTISGGKGNITAIRLSTTAPNMSSFTADNTISISSSPYPVYMWYDNGVINIWSEANNFKISDCGSLCEDLTNLNDISGLFYFDPSNSTNFANARL